MNKPTFWRKKPISYVIATAAVALMTAVIYVLRADSMANISMPYLMIVTVSALFLGRGPAVLCSVLSFLAFDWFFVEPKYQFTVQNPSEWLALCMFLFTATIIGQLTGLLKTRMEEAQRSRTETVALAEASWAVASDIDRDRVLKKLLDSIGTVAHADASAMFWHNDPNQEQDQGTWLLSSKPMKEDEVSSEAIRYAMVQGQPIGWDESQHWAKALSHLHKPGTIYLPVTLEDQTLGVICMKLPHGRSLESHEKRVVNSLVNHAAVVLHRDKLLQIQTKAQALAEVDRLKTALLSMVSHDFRSPLTSIKASVGSLLQEGSHIDAPTQLSLLQAVDQEADRLDIMVGNILDLSRLEADAWKPRREIIPIEELIGPVLDSFDDAENKRIEVDINHGVKDLWIDSVQMTQVLHNLIENSLKYSSDKVTIRVFDRNGSTGIEILDKGPGLPKGEEQDIFKPFYRAAGFRESSLPGMGIGLAVCQGLVEAHQGILTASNRDGGGAAFQITLPREPKGGEKIN